ncbi:glycoside hydrolase family 43 protein [Sphingobacterium chuzhouense]|uniref:Family 43 glycosylhydrolase n=1 Tax=Sphingobacterium chuzhouense TaxID=1742264 RepID=A0ABR7XN42_9SPHI|nr:glycoside hydrolase family 43 protein [Sphingobacterium chuzhouense]MBD1420598.1 family 43 glycosylhydrolase [Sphingobacterium chuzhouense]
MKIFLNYIYILFSAFLYVGCGSLQKSEDMRRQQTQMIDANEMSLRDPFILYDRKSDYYYTYANNKPSIKGYRSKDLQAWEDIGNVFIPENDFWGKEDFWAPDCYYYRGKYYLFVTFSDVYKKRGTSILVSDYPDKDFKPLVNAPITPKEWMSLDAALYVDQDDKPWMLFCREWLEVTDGEIYAQRVSDDLTTALDEPILLFKASAAPWVKGIYSEQHDKHGNITDAPFIHRGEDGILFMLWSSFDLTGKYAIGVAYSASGKIEGPWRQSENPLNSDDGGHGMLFRTRNGKFKISYHAPNSGSEKLIIKNAKIKNGVLTIAP